MVIMEFFKKPPNKRMRLDLQNKFDVNVGNEDLWGQEDITAEEFDMLEVQATQECSASFHQPFPKNSHNDTSFQVDIMKQNEYELEGKVKILTESLEKLKKDFKEEKLQKERLFAEKVLEFQQKESTLKKEIEKIESALQFKDQEMKTVYAKAKVLEVELKEMKAKNSSATSISPNKFLEKFNFKSDAGTKATIVQQQGRTVASHKKYRLSLDTPRGKILGQDIISSLLCNKLISPIQSPYVSSLSHTPMDTEALPQNTQLSAISVARISLEQETEEIFHYSCRTLKNYLNILQNFSSKSNTNSNSPISLRKRDALYDRATVISCLKDLTFMISCPQFSSIINKSDGSKHSSEGTFQKMETENVPSTSVSLVCDKIHKTSENRVHYLLKLLFRLAIPDTYPSGYLKSEEIEWSLSALVSWSSASPKSLLAYFDDQIVSSHINSCYSIATSCIVLKLLINISTDEEYLPKLIHKESCHLCAISVLLLRNISVSPLEYISLMLMIEDFLSTVFAVYTFSDLKLDVAPCSVMVLQAILSSLEKYYKVKKDNSDVTYILKKGFLLLHLLSRYFPNFKERRRDFENLYIFVVCSMLMLSKENPLFKDFYELAHELWDFQEDTSEFDLEDTSDDSITTMTLQSQNDCS